MRFFNNYKFHLLFFFLAFLLLSKFSIDPDLGWHLAMGRDFLAHNKLWINDTYSWTLPGFVWFYPIFFYQILVFFLVTHVGFLATALIFGLAASFSVLILLPKKFRFDGFIVSLLGLILCIPSLGVRPHIFDLLFFALLVRSFWAGFYRKKIGFLFIFSLFAVWVNLHVGVWIGFGFLVIFLLLETLKDRGKHILRNGILVISAFLGTLMTPQSLLIWGAGISGHLAFKGWFELGEFSPVIVFFPYNLFFALSGLVLIFMFKKRLVPMEWLVMGAGVFIFTFLCSCLLVFWAAIFIFLSARCIYVKKGQFISNVFRSLGLRFILGLCVLVLALNFLTRLMTALDFRQLAGDQKYPLLALEFMQKKGIGLNLYNEYSWGGFIDWQFPKQRVFIDGRMAAWPKRDGSFIFDDYLAILRGGNCGLVSKYGIKSVVLPANAKIPCFGDFKVVYRDKAAKVLLRK